MSNEAWKDEFQEVEAVFEAPGESDHSRCVVDCSVVPLVRKSSFKYFSFLSSHPSFIAALEEAWGRQTLVGSKLYMLSQKLKAIKVACKTLNKDGFSNIQQRTKDSLLKLQEIQNRLLTAPTDSLFREEFIARKQWTLFKAALKIFYERKSRIRWLRDGDSCTKFFFKAVQAHQAVNVIRALVNDSGVRIINQAQVKDMIVAFYSALLGSVNVRSEVLSAEEQRRFLPYKCPHSLEGPLSVVPSAQEVKDVLFAMPKNKAPGADGFPVEFFLEAWEVVGEETIEAIREFFLSSRMLQRFNVTVITLLPKVPGADSISAFRPISLCSTIYKCISRLIKQRLQLFVRDAVQSNQVGFVKGRMLCENVLLASELVVDFHKTGAVRRGCLKIDISKAFDSVDWDFLFTILEAINVPLRLKQWIKECVTTPTYSVAVNGELHGFFKGKRGLRQGDPISSLLFTLVMDVLSKMLDAGATDGVFTPHPQCFAPLVTHLSFADDVLIFFDGTEQSLAGILSILDRFKSVSGLGLNRRKSELLLDGGNDASCRAMAEKFGIAQGSLPLRYLGVPLSSRKMKKTDFQPMLDRIGQRFSSWTARHLSFAGRIQLIQSVIYSTIAFWASVFIIPNQCIRCMESMCNAFLWSGAPNSARGAKVAWDSVCLPKKKGGLGIKRLADWNKVLGLKLIWLIFTASGSLWISWLRRNLIGNQIFWELSPDRKGSWIWRSICKLRTTAHRMLVCKVASGITASFWYDAWTDYGPLIEVTGDAGPAISGLSRKASVADGLVNGEWWVNRLRSRNPVLNIIRQCLPQASAIANSEADDVYLWKPDPARQAGQFSSLNTWKSLFDSGSEVSWHKAVWFNGRIPKHAFICWLAARNRMVTRDKLLSWGLEVPAVCTLCNSGAETRNHLFFDCAYSSEVWRHFTSGMNLTSPAGFEEKLLWLKTRISDQNIVFLKKLLFQACIYLLWKERNSRIHTNTARPPASIIEDIKRVIRFKLDPLSRLSVSSSSGHSVLGTWFSFF